VCLAAICVGDDGNPRIVVAADRMVTYPGFIEFEHTVRKITPTTPHSVTMVAGDALVGSRLARETAGAIYGSNPPIAQVAQQLAINYESVRNQWAETQILTPRGLNFQSYFQGHASLNGHIVQMIDQSLSQYDVQIELLLAGVDGSGAHLYTVHNPGRMTRQHDTIGFGAVGSGWIHAMQSMIGFRHSPDATFEETMYRVFASKRRAEVTPGVGVETDMVVISPAGVQFLTEDQLGALDALNKSIVDESANVLVNRAGYSGD